MSGTYSFKVIIHKVFLQPIAFSQDHPILESPAFQVKFVDFAPFKIQGKLKLQQEHFKINYEELTEKEDDYQRQKLVKNSKELNNKHVNDKRKSFNDRMNEYDEKRGAKALARQREQEKLANRQKNAEMLYKKMNPKFAKNNENAKQQEDDPNQMLKVFQKKKKTDTNDEINESIDKEEQEQKLLMDTKAGFGKGKVVVLNVEKEVLRQYLQEYALVVEFIDQDNLDEEEEDKVIGHTLINMRQFIEDLDYMKPLVENNDYFRRNTFQLYDVKDRSKIIGWYDMSLAFQLRPQTYVQILETKKQVPHFMMDKIFANRAMKLQQIEEQEEREQNSQIDLDQQRVDNLDQENIQDKPQIQKNNFMDKSDPKSQKSQKSLKSDHKDEQKSQKSQNSHKTQHSQKSQRSQISNKSNKFEETPQQLQQRQQQQIRKKSGISESYDDDFESMASVSVSKALQSGKNYPKYQNNMHQQSIEESYGDDFESEQSQSIKPNALNFTSPKNQPQKNNFYKVNNQLSSQQSNRIQESIDEYGDDFEDESLASYQKSGQSKRFQQSRFQKNNQKKSDDISENYSEDFDDFSQTQSAVQQRRKSIQQEKSVISDVYTDDFEHSVSQQIQERSPQTQVYQPPSNFYQNQQNQNLGGSSPVKRVSATLVRKN